MDAAVTIKGTKSGIILVLDPSLSFEDLCLSIKDKFKEASSFLGRNNMGLHIRGRQLSDVETDRVVEIIQANSNLTITCIIDDESVFETGFKRAMGVLEPQQEPVQSDVPLDDTFDDSALIYRGNLRSGQDISSEKSIVVMGDVKPGANVTSYGSIYILGELRGNAFAGAGGDRDAIIMALDLRPIQVRIADAIAISPDAEKGAKLKVKKKKFLSSTEGDPEVAYIENGHIVKTGYGASFLREFYKI
ncbi:septum site-determining protein MinC [Butyrivibrio sp. VCB2001]|uniref:septum site-determining protein MinC n=1 Tax=Butyrivibrio sp. VCB2001 TaxID=1280667 RepID=UPI0012DE33CE|nr:septum site-determining protein MinC [Butyrivibrio sp. VCB2001]